jgi:hypothetical protein
MIILRSKGGETKKDPNYFNVLFFRLKTHENIRILRVILIPRWSIKIFDQNFI